jgi:hypothetical protein
MPKTEAFDKHIAEYEQWFIDNHFVFQSELVASETLYLQKARASNRCRKRNICIDAGNQRWC